MKAALSCILFFFHGVQFSKGDSCANHVRQLYPRGGPMLGDTAVTVTGVSFQNLGDPKCKFGLDIVTAQVVNSTQMICYSPQCKSPNCIATGDLIRKVVPLEVSMNGVLYTNSGLQYTYYELAKVKISHYIPAGGPIIGGTIVTVSGSNFLDLDGGVAGTHYKGAKCKFGTNAMVNATFYSQNAVICESPIHGTGISVSANVNLEFTPNGYDTEDTITEPTTNHATTTQFTYYEDKHFNVTLIDPLGGPSNGGTTVTVHLVNFVTGIGGLQYHGAYCRFGTATKVPATLQGDSKQYKCKAPAYTGTYTNDKQTVALEMSLNGQQFSDAKVMYTYYNQNVVIITHVIPSGGPLLGNSNVTIKGLRLDDLGHLQCRFGPKNALTNATLVPADKGTAVNCLSPAHWRATEGAQTVMVDVTLNGEDFVPSKKHVNTYHYYEVNRPIYGLQVTKVMPNGGPSGGLTHVTVTGTNFADRGSSDGKTTGLYCKFTGLEIEKNEATYIDTRNIRCTSPSHAAIAVNVESVYLEVTINGQENPGLTSSRITYDYYKQSSIRVSKIYPQGGPKTGGSAVTVYGTGFKDYGHGKGLKCRFGTSDLVQATLITLGGDGIQRLTCTSPDLDSLKCQSVVVSVTNNDDPQSLTSDSVLFTYYEP